MTAEYYESMSDEKLKALLEVEEGEEKSVIEGVLAARKAPKTVVSCNGKPVAIRITDAEREALAEKLRAEVVYHKCRVVPFNATEWEDGVIITVIEEKKTNKVLLAIRLDDGRRVVKTPDSKLLEVLPEKVDAVPLKRGPKRGAANPKETPWTDDDVEAAMKDVIGNVGRMVTYPEAGAYGLLTDSGTFVTGRIVSIIPVKRNRCLLYRVEVDDGKGGKKFAHKMTNGALRLGEMDELGNILNRKFRENRYGKEDDKEEAKTANMTEKQFFDYAAEMYAKARVAFEKQQRIFERREAAYLEAKAAYEKSINK